MNLVFISNVCGSKYYFFLSSDNKASIIVLSELQSPLGLAELITITAALQKLREVRGPVTQHSTFRDTGSANL